eukprot:366387-Chlamydomonas_euryale.AAC.10
MRHTHTHAAARNETTHTHATARNVTTHTHATARNRQEACTQHAVQQLAGVLWREHRKVGDLRGAQCGCIIRVDAFLVWAHDPCGWAEQVWTYIHDRWGCIRSPRAARLPAARKPCWRLAQAKQPAQAKQLANARGKRTGAGRANDHRGPTITAQLMAVTLPTRCGGDTHRLSQKPRHASMFRPPPTRFCSSSPHPVLLQLPCEQQQMVYAQPTRHVSAFKYPPTTHTCFCSSCPLSSSSRNTRRPGPPKRSRMTDSTCLSCTPRLEKERRAEEALVRGGCSAAAAASSDALGGKRGNR